MNILLLDPAQQELDEAIAWYTGQAPGLGDAFLIVPGRPATTYPEAVSWW